MIISTLKILLAVSHVSCHKRSTADLYILFFPYTGNGHSWHLFSVIAFHGDKANQTSSNDIWGTPFIDSTTAQSHENVSLLISTKKLFVIYWMGPFYRQN